MVISMKIKQNMMKWMGVCLTMTMLTGCTGQAEPTAAAQDETMEQVTIAAIGGSATEGEEAKAFTIQCIGYSDGEETVTEAESDREDMSLSGKYAGNFPIGVALPAHVLGSISRYDDVIQNNFNIMTCENETKPDALLDQQASQSGLPRTYENPCVHFDACQPAVEYALKNNMKLRLHTLVWHSQTPRWFFTEDYTNEGELVGREVMLKRMDAYIRSVLEYFDTQYPGLIYAVDVVNEAFDVGNGDQNGVRQKDNLWYEMTIIIMLLPVQESMRLLI